MIPSEEGGLEKLDESVNLRATASSSFSTRLVSLSRAFTVAFSPALKMAMASSLVMMSNVVTVCGNVKGLSRDKRVMTRLVAIFF